VLIEDHSMLRDAVAEDALVTEVCKLRLEKVTLAKPGMLTLHKRELVNTHHKDTLNSSTTIAEIQLPSLLKPSGAIPLTLR